MQQDFICKGCGHTWSLTTDKDGFLDGCGSSQCPMCGDSGCAPYDYADYNCNYCNHHWRQYGNGGLVFGCVPLCPSCGTLPQI